MINFSKTMECSEVKITFKDKEKEVIYKIKPTEVELKEKVDATSPEFLRTCNFKGKGIAHELIIWDDSAWARSKWWNLRQRFKIWRYFNGKR